MPKKRELMRKLVYLVIILLELIFVFSYRNIYLNIEGICEECAADTHYMMEIGAVMVATQIIIGGILYLRLNEDNNFVTFILNILLGSVGAVLSFCQIFYFLEYNGGHEELSAAGQAELNLVNMQIIFIRIVSMLLILTYVLLILLSLYNIFLIQKGIVKHYMYNVDSLGEDEQVSKCIHNNKFDKVFMNLNIILLVVLAIALFALFEFDFEVFLYEYMYFTPILLNICLVNKCIEDSKTIKAIVMYAILGFVSYRIINTCMQLDGAINIYIIGVIMTGVAYVITKIIQKMT